MPTPLASIITLSPRQKRALEGIVHKGTNPHRLVRRAQLILGAANGKSNTELSVHLELSRTQVQCWRDRWQEASATLNISESEEVNDAQLRQKIESILSDKPRPGTTATFTLEQIVQIIAIACELPGTSNRPISHWTPAEVANEAIKRGIVEQISTRTVGRFLKGRCFTTSSGSILAQRQPH
ncbi:MAG: transposase [Thermosynechococcaceae cyanobacterium]